MIGHFAETGASNIYGLQASGNRLYVGEDSKVGFGDPYYNRLRVLDLEDPTKPKSLGDWKLPQPNAPAIKDYKFMKLQVIGHAVYAAIAQDFQPSEGSLDEVTGYGGGLVILNAAEPLDIQLVAEHWVDPGMTVEGGLNVSGLSVTAESLYLTTDFGLRRLTPGCPECGVPCDDGNPCNGAESCGPAGICVSTAPPTCDDEDPCTADTCDASAEGGCVQTSDGEICDDGNTCTADTCDPIEGCLHSPTDEGEPCDDGDACTLETACDTGTCACGDGCPAPDCDDGNPCTADTCDASAEGGCVHTPDGEICDDGNTCTTDTCDPIEGCLHAPTDEGGDCDDGDACTLDTTCAEGICACGDGCAAPDCDDGNPCTTDDCDPFPPVIGCTYTDNSEPCDDGNKCTANDQCFAGKCTSSGTKCDDDEDPCLAEWCDPATGECMQDVMETGTFCDTGESGGACGADGLCQSPCLGPFEFQDDCQDPAKLEEEWEPSGGGSWQHNQADGTYEHVGEGEGLITHPELSGLGDFRLDLIVTVPLDGAWVLDGVGEEGTSQAPFRIVLEPKESGGFGNSLQIQFPQHTSVTSTDLAPDMPTSIVVHRFGDGTLWVQVDGGEPDSYTPYADAEQPENQPVDLHLGFLSGGAMDGILLHSQVEVCSPNGLCGAESCSEEGCIAGTDASPVDVADMVESHIPELDIQGGYAYLASGEGGAALSVVDLTDEAQDVTFVSPPDGTGAGDDVSVSGDYVYVTHDIYNDGTGVSCWDVSTPLSPQLVGTMTKHGSGGGVLHAVDVHGLGSHVLIRTKEPSSLELVRFAGPGGPATVSGLSLESSALDMAVWEAESAIFTSMGSQLGVVRITEGMGLELVNTVDVSSIKNLVMDTAGGVLYVHTKSWLRGYNAKALMDGESGETAAYPELPKIPSLTGGDLSSVIYRDLDVVNGAVYVAAYEEDLQTDVLYLLTGAPDDASVSVQALAPLGQGASDTDAARVHAHGGWIYLGGKHMLRRVAVDCMGGVTCDAACDAGTDESCHLLACDPTTGACVSHEGSCSDQTGCTMDICSQQGTCETPADSAGLCGGSCETPFTDVGMPGLNEGQEIKDLAFQNGRAYAAVSGEPLAILDPKGVDWALTPYTPGLVTQGSYRVSVSGDFAYTVHHMDTNGDDPLVVSGWDVSGYSPTLLGTFGGLSGGQIDDQFQATDVIALGGHALIAADASFFMVDFTTPD
ncbi:MAG: hypothetical protein VYE15_07980, partial [Myxococcota bacterium]|nr:hypothetical protein [Myxococcota bacterium]